MTILGIETSCDESALALIETRANTEFRIIQSLIHSQAELHSAYGGVYPNLAKREHSKNLIPLLNKIISDFDIKKEITDQEFNSVLDSFRHEFTAQNSDLFQSIQTASFLKRIPKIDAIAVTEGPGLEPALWVGINFARILGALWQVPIVPINHMEGHIIGSLINDDAPYSTWQKLLELPLPSIALLISGGHTELVQVEMDNNVQSNSKNNGAPFMPKYTILGQTLDDAVGEAFDKTARLLELPYPGGPHISRMAKEAEEAKIPSPIKLPRPMINSGDLNFSFSGLKTAVLYAVKKVKDSGQLSGEYKKGLAYEFEQAVADVLDTKLRMAIDRTKAKSIIIGGGVSANNLLRKRFEITAKEYNIPIFMPSKHVSGDNALMIALAGSLWNTGSNRTLRAQGTMRL